MYDNCTVIVQSGTGLPPAAPCFVRLTFGAADNEMSLQTDTTAAVAGPCPIWNHVSQFLCSRDREELRLEVMQKSSASTTQHLGSIVLHVGKSTALGVEGELAVPLDPDDVACLSSIRIKFKLSSTPWNTSLTGGSATTSIENESLDFDTLKNNVVRFHDHLVRIIYPFDYWIDTCMWKAPMESAFWLLFLTVAVFAWPSLLVAFFPGLVFVALIKCRISPPPQDDKHSPLNARATLRKVQRVTGVYASHLDYIYYDILLWGNHQDALRACQASGFLTVLLFMFPGSAKYLFYLGMLGMYTLFPIRRRDPTLYRKMDPVMLFDKLKDQVFRYIMGRNDQGLAQYPTLGRRGSIRRNGAATSSSSGGGFNFAGGQPHSRYCNLLISEMRAELKNSSVNDSFLLVQVGEPTSFSNPLFSKRTSVCWRTNNPNWSDDVPIKIDRILCNEQTTITFCVFDFGILSKNTRIGVATLKCDDIPLGQSSSIKLPLHPTIADFQSRGLLHVTLTREEIGRTTGGATMRTITPPHTRPPPPVFPPPPAPKVSVVQSSSEPSLSIAAIATPTPSSSKPSPLASARTPPSVTPRSGSPAPEAAPQPVPTVPSLVPAQPGSDAVVAATPCTTAASLQPVPTRRNSNPEVYSRSSSSLSSDFAPSAPVSAAALGGLSVMATLKVTLLSVELVSTYSSHYIFKFRAKGGNKAKTTPKAGPIIEFDHLTFELSIVRPSPIATTITSSMTTSTATNSTGNGAPTIAPQRQIASMACSSTELQVEMLDADSSPQMVVATGKTPLCHNTYNIITVQLMNSGLYVGTMKLAYEL